MARSDQDRRVFLSAVFFAFGILCGILTGKYASAALAASTAGMIADYFGSSVMASCILAAMAVPLLLLFLSMTLFGSFLILPCVLLAGGGVGWSMCCLLRCGLMDTLSLPLLFCALAPQAPCLMFIAAACMRLSASLRMMVTYSALRKPDVSVELRSLAVSLSVKLMTAILFAMLLKRLGSF